MSAISDRLRDIALHAGPKTIVNTSDLLALLGEYEALCTAGQPKHKAASRKTASADSDLPAWLPIEAWRAFLAMRAKIKKPATDYAQKLLLKKLEKFADADVSVLAVLEQSIARCWQDLYAPQDQDGAARGFDSRNGRAVTVRPTRQQQQQQANQEALARLNGIPFFDKDIIDV